VVEDDWLAARFEENRDRLRGVAYRMLGSTNDAEDAVQETWLRLSRTDADEIDNLGGWLTTVVARVSLDLLRSRGSRREEALPDNVVPIARGEEPVDPEHEAVLGDSIGLALLVVLETLAPEERLAFVLHDMFAVPFEEIAPIVGRTPAAARQLASRARRRVQGADPDATDADLSQRRAIVDAFLKASREGRFEDLLALLHPDAVVRADAAAVAIGAGGEARGAQAVAQTFSGRAKGALLATIDGEPGLVWAMKGSAKMLFEFDIAGGKVVGITLVADPTRLKGADLVLD
jgi:RNA polymerase sigma-70 factor (ECF subfamily)